jgi:hypothetical protein
LIGSMSHLAKNGLNFYAPILVETMTRMAGKVGPGVNVIPFVPVPIGGIGSETLARDMMDLDSWIVSTGAGQATGLPDTRDAFWRIVLADGGEGRRVYTSSAPLSLPAGIRNPRIRPFMSGAFVGTVPAEIPPLKQEDETKIVRTLLNELNEKFGVNLDCQPSFERNVPPPFTVHSAGRTVFIGASNMGKIAKAAAENGHMVVDLTSGGWTPKTGKIEKVSETLEKLDLTGSDTVVIDPMSNSAYLGTDEDGLPIPAEKSDEDGRYHLLGDLQLAPPSAFKNCFKNMERMLVFAGGAKVVFIVPLPRYVISGCCNNSEHVTNRLSGELAAEFAGAEKCLVEAATMGERTGVARIINLLSFFGSGESPPQDLTIVDGTSIWAGDGVHLTTNASRVAARKLMADLASGGEEGEPAHKRARLESVVPAPVPAKKKATATGQPPTSPPRPAPPQPPLWLSGQLPPQRGRGTGRQNPGQRGGWPVRGDPRGGSRGANRGQRGPPRGGPRGRWGRW